jgi:transcriptional regulator with XRE-family HTH domain
MDANGSTARWVKLERAFAYVMIARRRELGMSKADLARALDMWPHTLGRVEAGQELILDRVWQVSRALELPASVLVARLENVVALLAANGIAVTLRRVEPRAPPDGAELTTPELDSVMERLLKG